MAAIEVRYEDMLAMAQGWHEVGRGKRAHTEIEMRDGTIYTLGAGPFERDQYGRYRGLRKFVLIMPDGSRLETKTTIRVNHHARQERTDA